MNGTGGRYRQGLRECWQTVEGHFYELWSRGLIWFPIGIMGLIVSALLVPDGLFFAWRVGWAGLVLGVGVGILKVISFWRLAVRFPEEMLVTLCQIPCQSLRPIRRRLDRYLRLMEGGFIVLECIVLLGLLGFSTTALASSPLTTGERAPFWLILLVYGFFMTTFSVKEVTTALGWAYWVRRLLEDRLGWEGTVWLLGTGRWQRTRLNLMRPISEPSFRDRMRKEQLDQKALRCLVALVFTLSLGIFLALLLLVLGR